MDKPERAVREVRVWDFPIRFFHWLLAALVTAMYASAKLGLYDIHFVVGQALVALLATRVAWGFAGSSNLSFKTLFAALAGLPAYVKTLGRRAPGYGMGHSPLGSLATLALLGALAVQVSTGLLATDVDGLLEGPLAYYVDYDLSRFASDVHLLNERIILALVALHLGASAFYYFYKRDNLVLPMITGARRVPQDVVTQPPHLVPAWRSFAIMAAVGTAVGWTLYVYG